MKWTIADLRLLIPMLAMSAIPLSALSQSGGLGILLEKERAREAQEKKISEVDEALRKKAEQSLERGKRGKAADEAGALRRVYNSEKELPVAERKLISPDPETESSFRDYLNRKDRGVFRLLSFNEQKLALNDVRMQTAYPGIPGSGTYYSFATGSHVSDEWSQIRLLGGWLTGAYREFRRNTSATAGGISQSYNFVTGYGLTIFKELGDIPLDQVGPDHVQATALRQLLLPKTVREMSGWRLDNRAGFEPKVELKSGTTFLIRSVLFKRVDSIMAFRVVRQDGEKGVDIVWKQIDKLPAAQLKIK